MSRYIETDDAIEAIRRERNIKALLAIPSIDIVRCKECKYCVSGQCWKVDGLDKLDGNVADDDFCSRGEREGE